MDIRIPEVGESVHEALLARWFKKNGDPVKKDEPLCEIETDKITLDINCDATGILTVQVQEGATVKIGAVIGTIAENALPANPAASGSGVTIQQLEEKIMSSVSSPAARREMREHQLEPDSVSATGKAGRITLDDLFSRIEQKSRRVTEVKVEQEPVSEPVPLPEAAISTESISKPLPIIATPTEVVTAPESPRVTPPSEPLPVPLSVPATTAAAVVEPIPVNSPVVSLPITQPAVLADSVHSEEQPAYGVKREERVPLSPIRKRIAERLLAARQQTAMLTTFNEVDMSCVMAIREQQREQFLIRHGVALGYMSFFVAACCQALKEFPLVNASLDGNDLLFHHYYDIGIAIGAEKGLVVPVVRDADKLRLHEIEEAIATFSDKIKTNRLAISDLEGGTFTISNGGVYGSLLSTPIINPPQSAVLGMHAIQDRPVVRDGQIVIRPMMNLALSYDHRIIDGRDAVRFLKKIIAVIEGPKDLLPEG